MSKPKNMTEMRDQMLDLIEDMKKGLVRVADAKERCNAYGKVISSAKVQLEQKVFQKDQTGIGFLEDK